jgi:hypothetical protein
MKLADGERETRSFFAATASAALFSSALFSFYKRATGLPSLGLPSLKGEKKQNTVIHFSSSSSSSRSLPAATRQFKPSPWPPPGAVARKTRGRPRPTA